MTDILSLVVPTKDRPDDLRRLLESLRNQTARPHQVVVVDASAEPVEVVVTAFPELNPTYIRHWPPSASAQRNAGVQACDPRATLIGFIDDDTIFEPESFERMLRFWERASPELVGAAFNIRHYPLRGGHSHKRRSLASWLGLYPSKAGAVAQSGWHSAIGCAVTTGYLEWLPTTAVVWRSDVPKRHAFDEFFDGYSYLEDLDFSYSVSRHGRLAVVAEAGCSHFPSPSGRVSTRQFGRVEMRNRLYFVKKHGLSRSRCYAGIGIRLAMTVFNGLMHFDPEMFGRAAGNLDALIRPDRDSGRPKSGSTSEAPNRSVTT